MIELYNNEFENVDENSIAAALNEFVASLDATSYEKINTNAKYDTTFNDGFNYLKNTDIGSMTTLCRECYEKIVYKIQLYKTNYQLYKKNYDNYKKTYEQHNQWINNGKEGTEPPKPDSSNITTAEANLKELANKIRNATFN